MDPSTTTAAGVIDPALVPEREAVALRAELARALDVPPDAAVALTIRVDRGAGAPADVAIPAAWRAELLRALAALADGRAVQWAAEPSEADHEIGTGELARLLGVSAPTAAAVLDRGEIPSHRTTPGGHRRVSRAAALAWRRRRDAQAASLRDLVRMAERDEAPGPSLPAGTPEDPDDESEA